MSGFGSLNRSSSVLSRIRVDFRCFFFIILQLIVLASQDYYLQHSGEGLYGWCQTCCTFILINMALQAAFFQIIGRLLSLGSLFIASSYLVNSSFCILIAFGAQDPSSALMVLHLPRFGVDSFIEANRYALDCIGFTAIGCFCASAFKLLHVDEEKDKDNPTRGPEVCLVVGRTLSLVFGAVYFASTGIMVLISLRSGNYSAMADAMNLPFMNDAVNYHSFFFAGLFLLMAYYKQIGELRKSKQLMVFAVLCIILSFFSGVRSRGTMQLLVLLALWVACIEKPKMKTILVICVSGIIILQLMAAIRSVRSGELSLSSITDALFSLDNSLIFEVLNEYGNSLFATAGMMDWVSEPHAFDFVIKQLGSVLPSVSSWGGEVFLSPTVRTGFEDAYNLGSTYIVDVYYYFGAAGPLLAGIFGLWISLLEKRVLSRALSADYISIAAMMPGILAVFNSARASMDLGLKMFLYSAAIFYLVFHVCFERRMRDIGSNAQPLHNRGVVNAKAGKSNG